MTWNSTAVVFLLLSTFSKPDDATTTQHHRVVIPLHSSSQQHDGPSHHCAIGKQPSSLQGQCRRRRWWEQWQCYQQELVSGTFTFSLTFKFASQLAIKLSTLYSRSSPDSYIGSYLIIPTACSILHFPSYNSQGRPWDCCPDLINKRRCGGRLQRLYVSISSRPF